MNKLIAFGTLVLAFGAGTWSGYQAGSSEIPAAVAHADIPALVAREPGLSAGRADIDTSVLRALIREEMNAVLAARAGGSGSGNGSAVPTPVRETVTPEMQAQRREAQEQIDTIMAQGTWGNEQRLNFQQKLMVLDPDQREHALQQLTTGINNGTLNVTTDGPPL